MQVILTEEEYLKLKRQSDEDRKTYVKRIDVSLALEEMIKELVGCIKPSYDPLTFEKVVDWKRIIDQFHERIR